MHGLHLNRADLQLSYSSLQEQPFVERDNTGITKVTSSRVNVFTTGLNKREQESPVHYTSFSDFLIAGDSVHVWDQPAPTT